MTYRQSPTSPSPRHVLHGPVGNFGALFPRQHPLLGTVAALAGLALLGAGPVAGLPAIVLGRIAMQDGVSAPRLYTRAHLAKVGVVVAWVATIGWGTLWGALLGRLGVGGAYIVFGLGVLGIIGGGFAYLLASKGRAIPWWIRDEGVWMAVMGFALLGGAVGGIHWHGVDVREARARCVRLRDQALEASSAARFDEARERLAEAEAQCPPRQQAVVEELRSILDRHEAHYNAKLEEQREAQITRDFTKRRPALVAHVTAARSLASARRWEQAASELDEVDRALKDFAGAKVSSTTEFTSLRADVARERKVLAPELEKIAEMRAAAAERERKAEEARKAREAAIEQARQASLRLRCCDGTLSPSCLCSRSNRRGCCSHHGGICGCED